MQPLGVSEKPKCTQEGRKVTDLPSLLSLPFTQFFLLKIYYHFLGALNKPIINM